TLRLQMRHRIEGDSERHTGIQQVGHLLRKSGQFLELWSPLTLALKGCWQQRASRTFFLIGHRYRRSSAARAFDHDWKKTKPLDLHERRCAVRYVQNALHDFARLTARFVGKLWHRLISITEPGFLPKV